MSITRKTLNIFVSLLVVGGLAMSFQNCSKVEFAEELPFQGKVSANAIVKEASEQQIVDQEMAEQSQDSMVDDQEQSNQDSDSNQDDSQITDEVKVVCHDKNCNSNDENASSTTPGKSGGGKVIKADLEFTHGAVERADLVECEMLSSKNKIVLADSLKIGSNAIVSRICMSEHACLKLMNDFAAARDCSLDLAKSELSNSQKQCTRIFPGSRGTCKNAQVISDEELTVLLDKQAQLSK